MNAVNESSAPKPKKSVALSGVVAANTAICTVGRTGNDLHYRGYDILEIAEVCEFEEIAYLLIHERLPTRDRKSTRLNSSHSQISYAVFCLKKKKLSLTASDPFSTIRHHSQP